MFITKALCQLTNAQNKRYIRSHQPDYETMVPRFPESRTISHNIFQICLRGKKEYGREILQSLPDPFLKNIDHLQNNNPGWDYRLMGDRDSESFIEKSYGKDVLTYYRRIDERQGAARADFLRILLLYSSGGIYLDLKSSIKTPAHVFLKDSDRFLVLYWDDRRRHYLIPRYIEEGEIQTGIIIAAAGHPFLREIIIETMRRIDSYNPYEQGVGWQGVQQVTGPAMFTETIYNCIHSLSFGSAIYRVVLPIQTCGYQVSFLEGGNYVPGQYHKSTQIRDYRTLTCPVVRSSNRLLQVANSIWLNALSKHKKQCHICIL